MLEGINPNHLLPNKEANIITADVARMVPLMLYPTLWMQMFGHVIPGKQQ